MSRSKVLTSAFGAAFMAAVCAASPALALESKQCGSRAEIVQALHDEGQLEIISGQRNALGTPKNILTTNAGLSLGYNLEAGAGAEAGQVCIRAKYTDIHLNGDAQLARPSWASFGASTPHDEYLAHMEAKADDKVLMGATALVRRPDGSEVKGPFLMVMRGNAPGDLGVRNTGTVTVTSSQGGITTLLTMANVDTNDNFRSLAKTRVQTASVDAVTYRPQR